MNRNSEITTERISALIKSELQLQELGIDETFLNLGFSHDDLIKIQTRIAKAFSRTVSTVFFTDSVVSITRALNTKLNIDERSYH